MTDRLEATQRLTARAGEWLHWPAGSIDEIASAAVVLHDALRRGWDERALRGVLDGHGALGMFPPTRALAAPERWLGDDEEDTGPVPVAAVIDLAVERARRRPVERVRRRPAGRSS